MFTTMRIACAMFSGYLATAAIAQDLGKWTRKADLVPLRAEHGTACIGAKVYMAGGFDNNYQPKADLYSYDLEKDIWSAGPALPVALHHIGMVAYGGKAYVFGGVTHGIDNNPWNGSRYVFAYDPVAAKWTALKPLPFATAAAGVAVHGTKIYVFGGADTTAKDQNRTQEYDPATDTWRQLASMPTVREHCAAATLDSLIYVVGGRINDNPSLDPGPVEAYNPATDTWKTFAKMATPRSDLVVVAARGKLYAMGGEKPADYYPQNEEFDPATGQWRALAPLVPARKAFSGVAYDGVIWIFGGDAEPDPVGNRPRGFTHSTQAFAPPGWVTVVLPKVRARSARGAFPFPILLGRKAPFTGRGISLPGSAGYSSR